MAILDAPARPEAPSIGGGTGTGLLERPEEVTQDFDPGDHERFAHYVRKERILESAVTGRPVIALCGKVWVPNRDPNQFPVCPTCKEIYEGLKQPQDGGPGSGGSGSGGSGGSGGPGGGSTGGAQ
jgi:uncharacterized membrane protein YgcG